MPGVRQTDAGVVLTSSGVAQTVVSEIPDSVVSRFEYENNIDDSEGSISGTNNGITFANSPVKQGSYSAELDGSSYITFSESDWTFMDGTQDFSISVWVRIRSYQGQSMFWRDDANGKLFLGIGEDTGDISLPDDKISMQMNRASWAGVVSSTTVDLDTWYHVVGTYSETDGMTLYVDSVSEDTDGNTGATQNDDNNAPQIGARQTSGIDGYLDDTMIADDELTPDQVQDLYDMHS